MRPGVLLWLAPEKLEQGSAEFDLRYPVMLDNDYTVWEAFANKYWLSKYLIGADGYVRYFQAGEGASEETVLAIQELLLERKTCPALPAPMPLLRALDTPGALSFCQQPTPEFHLEHRRGRTASEDGLVEDREHLYDLGAGPMADLPELGGRWHSLPNCVATAGDARLCVIYSGVEVNLVVSPMAESGLAEMVIRRNGAPLGLDVRGDDIAERAEGQTVVRVTRPRLYSLVRGGVLELALLEISCSGRGVQMFAFTFGSRMEDALEKT